MKSYEAPVMQITELQLVFLETSGDVYRNDIFTDAGSAF